MYHEITQGANPPFKNDDDGSAFPARLPQWWRLTPGQVVGQQRVCEEAQLLLRAQGARGHFRGARGSGPSRKRSSALSQGGPVALQRGFGTLRPCCLLEFGLTTHTKVRVDDLIDSIRAGTGRLGPKQRALNAMPEEDYTHALVLLEGSRGSEWIKVNGNANFSRYLTQEEYDQLEDTGIDSKAKCKKSQVYPASWVMMRTGPVSNPILVAPTLLESVETRSKAEASPMAAAFLAACGPGYVGKDRLVGSDPCLAHALSLTSPVGGGPRTRRRSDRSGRRPEEPVQGVAAQPKRQTQGVQGGRVCQALCIRGERRKGIHLRHDR